MRLKRMIAALLACLLCLGAASAVLAATVGDRRVAIGADLTVQERAQIYLDFGIVEGTVPELIVTNADERAYLLGLVDEAKIGTVALSCIYIEILEPGRGLSVTTNNINYCTPEMYKGALSTAGITDALVSVSAPHPVSGTAALTGVYKAYEAIAGSSLSELAKSVGAEELITTGQLAEYIGGDEATVLISQLKTILDQTVNMTDAEVEAQIGSLAAQYNIQLTQGQTTQLLKLCRSLEKLDTSQLRDKLVSLSETVEKAGAAKAKVESVLGGVRSFSQSVNTFFSSISGFFKNLFGAKG